MPPSRARSRRFVVMLGAAISGCAGAEEPSPPPVLGTPTPGVGAVAQPAAPQAPVAKLDAVPDGASLPAAAPPAPAPPPRVYAKTRFVWIREKPTWEAPWLGYLWQGGSVALRDGRPVYAKGCDAWYAVEPRGFVCVDRRRATLDANDAELAAVRAHAPDLSSASPHRYAESLGVERYASLPDPGEQRAREPDLPRHLALLEAARRGGPRDESLAGLDLAEAPEDAVRFASLPVELQLQRRALSRRSTIAFLGEYRHEGRSFLLTSDLAWVPKDRVRPYDPVRFEGVRLDARVKLPLAFFRERERPSFVRAASGAFTTGPRTFPRLSWVTLTGREERSDGHTYLETTVADAWVRADDAVVPRPAAKTPWGAPTFGPDEGATRPPGRATWLEASVYGGWLIAYEGTRPVFVTLVAPGRNGALPANAPNLNESSSTPLGHFPVTGKFVTATMDAADGMSHADVPWVQNFWGAHAIHSAYWHDAWGELVSSGCLNVSPRDGRFLFEFSEPPLPEGWYGLRWEPRRQPSTQVLVHR
jgi:hypothetical protein